MSRRPYARLQEPDDVQLIENDHATKEIIPDPVSVEPPSYSSSLPPAYASSEPASQLRFPSESKQNQVQNDQLHPVPVARSAVLSEHLTAGDVLFSNGQPSSSVNNAQQPTHHVVNVLQVTPEEHQRYSMHMLLSCFVFWCCGVSGWVFGLVAFVLAMCASDASYVRGKEKEASNMGKASLVLSIIGAVLGVILTIVICVLYV